MFLAKTNVLLGDAVFFLLANSHGICCSRWQIKLFSFYMHASYIFFNTDMFTACRKEETELIRLEAVTLIL
jgi:hypothetical protein